MKRAVILFAEGYETVEALLVVDLLRRGGVEVTMASITEDEFVRSSHGVNVEMDAVLGEVDVLDYDAIILPGGMPGTLNLEKSADVQRAIDFCVENNKYIGAICAAPSILGHKGILNGKKATCYTGFETQLMGAQVSDEAVCTDGKIITSRGAGTAMEFAFELVKNLISAERRDILKESVIYKK